MKQNASEHAPHLRTAMVVLSFIVSFGALIFTYYQSIISNRGVQSQTWQGITQQGNYISQIFVDHPNLRPYFYNSKPINNNDPNYNAVMSVCELYLDFIDSMHDDYVYALPGMEKNGKTRKYWDCYFKDMFASSPALCVYAVEKQHWYSPKAFIAYMPSHYLIIYQKTSNKGIQADAACPPSR
jgi:hypothetical protein